MRYPHKIGMLNTMAPGLYIHVPFCLHKCRYCNFYSIIDLNLQQTYAASLIREMSLVDRFGDPFDTVYIGGGTPTVLQTDLLADLLEAAAARFCIDSHTEITIEVNPGTVDTTAFRKYRLLGINRIQIGAQSFQDKWLRWLGRIHTADQASSAISFARKAGFSNVGVDLIYGMPGQTTRNVVEDLERLCMWQPEHISCYMLTCEPGTPLDRSRKNGKFRMVRDEILAEQFCAVRDFLVEHGYHHYEISNFTRLCPNGSTDFRSRHNQKYWARDPYLGLGPSAHSYIPPIRRWNVSDLLQYERLISHSLLPLEEEEQLTRNQEIMEAIFLGLRRVQGISLQEMEKRYSIDLAPVVLSAMNDPFIQCRAVMDEQSFRLHPSGMVVMDSIVSYLIDRLIPER